MGLNIKNAELTSDTFTGAITAALRKFSEVRTVRNRI